jgi:hypothetical protein
MDESQVTAALPVRKLLSRMKLGIQEELENAS